MSNYTVLSYNINGYEIIHPVKARSDRAKYLMITDDPSLKDESDTWEVIYDGDLTGSPFDRCYQIRFNPWRYTDDEVIVRVDGSIGIEANLDKLVDRFVESGCDTVLQVHPYRNIMADEYSAWITTRGYSMNMAKKNLQFMFDNGYDVWHTRGLVQYSFQVLKRNRFNLDINRMTYALLKYLGDDETGIERIDQTVYTFLLQKFFPNANIMWVDQRIYDGRILTHYVHHSNVQNWKIGVIGMIEPYFFDRRITTIVTPEEL